ncbi:hypothetical protein LXL04_003884 [Taraxacum kok-saghyz]
MTASRTHIEGPTLKAFTVSNGKTGDHKHPPDHYHQQIPATISSCTFDQFAHKIERTNGSTIS